MSVHVYDSRAEEQHQLHEGMTDHVENRPAHRQVVIRAQEALHCDSREDEAELRHRGTCECALDVDGEDSKNRAEHHRNHSQYQKHEAPARVVHEDS